MGKLLKINILASKEGSKPSLREWVRGEIKRVKGQKELGGDLNAGNPEKIANQGQGLETSPSPVSASLGRGISDCSGSPSETYCWTHFGKVMTERRTQLRAPYLNSLEPSFHEITKEEKKVKGELYG